MTVRKQNAFVRTKQHLRKTRIITRSPAAGLSTPHKAPFFASRPAKPASSTEEPALLSGVDGRTPGTLLHRWIIRESISIEPPPHKCATQEKPYSSTTADPPPLLINASRLLPLRMPGTGIPPLMASTPNTATIPSTRSSPSKPPMPDRAISGQQHGRQYRAAI